MLIEICRTFINQVFNNIYHSVGNLVAKESIEKVYSIYKTYRFLNFWLYSFFTIFLAIMLEPFITIWIGHEFLMKEGLLFVLLFIFYEKGMRNSITTIKTTAGIFHEDRFAPLIQAIINLVVSIVLVRSMGIIGVFIGTLVSALVVPFWFTPYLVYKKIFKISVIKYYSKYITYLIIGFTTFSITNMISQLIDVQNSLSLILKGIICLLIPNLIYIILFRNLAEFKYLSMIIKNIWVKIQIRLTDRKKSLIKYKKV